VSECVSKKRAYLFDSFCDGLQPSTIFVVALHQRIMPLEGLHAGDDNDCTRLLLFTMNLTVSGDPSVNNEVFVSLTQRSK